MSDAEKPEMIANDDSMRTRRNGESEEQAAARQGENLLQLQAKLAALPSGKDPYEHLGYSNEAHDRILYDLEQD